MGSMEGKGDNSIDDARVVTQVTKQYFENLNPQLGYLFFRIESISPNSDENVWLVECSFLASLGSNERLHYRLKVNSKTGVFTNVENISKK